ncbi:MAG: sigma-54 dependent transcriptional regulator [Desulfobacterales bacterium]|jgi:two-component system NtrC family response regulator|nr:sigma-54 dependent transcriptional regulator [Desulfobacterales bacterium]MDD3081826.1 sigma-54 dependent transcriptional regulator [Desulfobacterales bacterium]MDD3950795.1 sigma-54 dependent transcriptional regulator [Desulfobacterales bacterium]MDD4463076.1 sigma-54 dependent transcriptional regulator [Desulfobacterales bacterium]MDY0376821.1 sigma-54 dependent transcriptional regulator [Desulfobacterales bacterium]
MDTILIVDDEKNYTLILSAVLQDEGFETLTANSGQEALETLAEFDVNLVITDMKMPVMDGIELLRHIKEKYPTVPVIMMTAYGTVEKAVEAMQLGAFNYITKPFDNARLVIYVNKALEMHHMAQENTRLRSEVEARFRFDNIIGKSKAMQDVFQIIRKVAPSAATVLIEGANGTGKELVAQSIHYNSPRRDKPFIAANCAAFAETLLESELFGHEKGAFTGATALKKGRFELADQGTLFLDEIGELSASLQVKLLRVLQERSFERVGGTKSISVDIRIIAATNKILKEEVAKGNFREDLFYRLNVIHIVLPSLRERPEDIRPLMDHFINKYAHERRTSVPVTGVSEEVERLFFDYQWPGNVRELENVIERAMIMCPGNTIQVSDLPKEFKDNVYNSLHITGIPADANLYDTLAMVEKKMIERALKISDNVQAHAAALLGIGKSGLNQKLKKYKLDK